MKIGYARVSTKKQNIDRQIKELNSAGVEKIFQEKISGTHFSERKELQNMLNFIRQDNMLVVDSLERLGRNYDEIIQNYSKNR